MNKKYKVVRNATTGSWVVVSELSKAHSVCSFAHSTLSNLPIVICIVFGTFGCGVNASTYTNTVVGTSSGVILSGGDNVAISTTPGNSTAARALSASAGTSITVVNGGITASSALIYGSGAVYAVGGGLIDLGDGSVITVAGYGNSAGVMGPTGLLSTGNGSLIKAINLSVSASGTDPIGIYAMTGASEIQLLGTTTIDVFANTGNTSLAFGMAANQGSITAEDVAITIAGYNGSQHRAVYGAYVSAGGNLSVTGTLTGNINALSYYGIGAGSGSASAYSKATFNDINLVGYGSGTSSGAAGIYAGGYSDVSVLGDASITTSSALAAYGIVMGNNAIVQLTGTSQFNSTGPDAGGITFTSSGGNATLNNTIFTINGSSTASAITSEQGSGTVGQANTLTINDGELNSNQDGIVVTGGTLNANLNDVVMTNGSGTAFNVIANPTYTSKLELVASRSTFTGNAALEFGATSNITLNDDSAWTITDDSTVTSLVLDNSTVRLASSSVGKILNVTGNYAGNNGTLIINTVLGDDNSLTDKLIVGGDTSGTTRVIVNNAGGTGQKTINGIEVIEVGGKSNGEFVQSGRIVAGSYEYFLGRGSESNSGNWYLSNTKIPEDSKGLATFRPESGSYITNLAAANTMFNTRLHDRIGDTQYTDLFTGEEKVTSLWLRQVGGHNRFHSGSGQLSTQSNRYVAQLGGDVAQWSHDGLDRWHLGVMAGYGNSQSNTESNVSHYRSRGQVTGYSAGLYGTWYANEADKTGSYLDSWVLYNWFDNTVSGQGIASEKYNSDGITASVEGGYSYLLGTRDDGRSSYWIQPEVQLTWMGVQAENHTEANGTRVKDKDDGNLQTRLGVRVYTKGHNAIDNSKTREFQPFVEANWIHNSRSYGVVMNGVTSHIQGSRDLGELKFGVEGQLNQNLHVWGNVAEQLGSRGYSDTQGMLGMKYAF